MDVDDENEGGDPGKPPAAQHRSEPTRRRVLVGSALGLLGAGAALLPVRRGRSSPPASRIWLADRGADRVLLLDGRLAERGAWAVRSPIQVVGAAGGRAWTVASGGALSFLEPGRPAGLVSDPRDARSLRACVSPPGTLVLLREKRGARALMLVPGPPRSARPIVVPLRGRPVGLAPWGSGVLVWSADGDLAWWLGGRLRAAGRLAARPVAARADEQGGWILAVGDGGSLAERRSLDLRRVWHRSVPPRRLVGPVVGGSLVLLDPASGRIERLGRDGALVLAEGAVARGAVDVAALGKDLVVALPGAVLRIGAQGGLRTQGGFDHLAAVAAVVAA